MSQSFAYYVGIDPGKTGAVAVLPKNPKGAALLLPMSKTPKDLWEMFGLVKGITGGDQLVMLERVHSMPRDGVKSAFTFGKWVAYVEMALVGHGLLPLDTVTPQTWMSDLGCMTKGDKSVTQSKAQLLFPDMKVTKIHADALLIAYYARKNSK